MNQTKQLPGRGVLMRLLLAGALAGGAVSCTAMQSGQMHGGIKYSIHPDSRLHRIEKGKDGSLMYDSPELTVNVQQGHMTINGQDAGPVKQGDHVEITELGEVKINGRHRGDVMTGYQQNKQRIQQAAHEWTVK